MKKIDEQIMKQVLNALGWTDQQYSQFIYDCGLAYLTAFIKGYDIVITQISRSEVFWDWWKMHWENREKEFIETITEYPESVTSVAELHKSIHDPADLATGIYLNGQVLQESYVSLIDAITKNQKQHEFARTF